MSLYRLTASAKADLADIWLYIALDNPRNADRFIDKIIRKCQLLAELPLMGLSREDFGPSLRSHSVGSYLIFYRPIKDGIEVHRVLHGARRLEDLLKP